MKLQRFLPLLLILALLGGAGYIASKNPEWFEDELEVRERQAYDDLITGIESESDANGHVDMGRAARILL